MSQSPFQRPPNNSDNSQNEPEPKPSLLSRLRALNIQPHSPPTPKPFHMTEPFQQPAGLWCFWLTADEMILDYVANLNCVMQMPPPAFVRQARGRVMYALSPRYNHEEAWMWIYRLLESETEYVELDNIWDGVFEDEPEERDLL
jgi:hypothetical protein